MESEIKRLTEAEIAELVALENQPDHVAIFWLLRHGFKFGHKYTVEVSGK
jgi:hypothetical protein